MALSHSPSIVTRNMILNLDVTNPRSYQNGPMWYDLSGSNNHGTLINMNSSKVVRTYGGKAFDLTNTGVYTTTPCIQTASIPFQADFTISAWFAFAATAGWQIGQAIACGYYVGATAYTWLFSNRSALNRFEFCYGQPGMNVLGNWGTSFSQAAVPITAMQNWVFTYSSTGVGGLYKNGIAQSLLGGNHGTPPYWQTRTGLCIGDGLQTSTTWSGAIDAVMVYNRALTRQEVLQNYNALRGRFGI